MNDGQKVLLILIANLLALMFVIYEDVAFKQALIVVFSINSCGCAIKLWDELK